MKTSALITLLASNAGPAPRAAVARRLGPAALAGLLASAALALALMGPVPAAMFGGGALWTKLAFAGALAAAAAWLAACLARPAASARTAACALLVVLALMALLALRAWFDAPATGRAALLLGHSWALCPWAVAALSLPGLAATLWALRGLAPTRPRAAGLAAGLLAGSVGALGYALACTEASTTFIAAWYSAGIALTGGLGALLGPRVLRW